MKKYLLFREADIPLEVVILLIAGTMMLVTGALLFPVSEGALPYYENGLYGLMLFMFALQIITLGKTPFGDMYRSRFLLAVGVVVAAMGIVTCFIPGILKCLPRLILVICLGPGGFLLLLQMCAARDKLRTWVKYRGISRHLILGCGMVYLLSMLIALLIWKQSLPAAPVTAMVTLAYGAAIIYLACVLWKVYCIYPEAERPCRGDVELSTDQAVILLMGIFMLLLGVLLIPVNLGLFPFSGSAQLGLLLVIFAVQMLASGNTPIGPFPRSWLLILSGIVFAALGAVSCLIPEILVLQLTVLVGVLNILGGAVTLSRILIPRLKKTEEQSSPADPVLTKLFAAQLTMNMLTILFGTSMLISNLIPGLVIGVILAANGCVLLYLLHIIIVLEKMQSGTEVISER